MKTTYIAIVAIILLFISTVCTQAIEGLKLSVQCSNVVLSWPSVDGETYVVQYRPTLDPSTQWQTLTSSLPADTGTNLTFFVHSNIVLNPVCDGGSFSMMMSGNNLPENLDDSEIESTVPMVMKLDGSGMAPLMLYPQGFDLSDFLIFDPLTGESVSGSGYEVSSFFGGFQANGIDPNDTNEPAGFGTNITIPDMGFYQVARIGVHILDLTNLTSGFVSNTITIPFEAANDIGMLLNVNVLVDGTRYRGAETLIAPGIYGKVIVDTSFLENGEHSFQIQGGWLNPDIMDVNNFILNQTSDSFTLSVSNFTYFPEWEDEVGELGFSPYFAKTVCTNADWQIQIYDSGSNYVQTLSGHTYDGIIETNWNMMDWQGAYRTNSETDPEFSGIIIVSDPVTNTLPKKVAKNPFPDHARWVIAYQDTFQKFQHSNDYYGALYTMGSVAQNFGGAVTTVPTNPTNGQTWPLRYPVTNMPLPLVSFATMGLDGRALEKLLTNSLNRNFFYNGHSGADQLAITLDTPYLNSILKHQYFRFVFIDGCNSANGGLPGAFGINLNAPQNISYFQKHGIRPRAFVGYPFTVYYAKGGDFIDPNTGEHLHYTIPQGVTDWLTNFEFYWYFNYDLATALYDATMSVPYVGSHFDTGDGILIYGFDGLRIDDYNYKYQWSN